MKPTALCSLLGAALAFCATPHLPAQTFSETFDAVGQDNGNGPVGLLARGFQFRTALTPGVVHDPWRQGPWHPSQASPYEGTGYLAQSIFFPPYGTYEFAEWTLLPAIPGLTTGQVVSFWVRGFLAGSFPSLGSVQLRYSPSGGTATGTLVSDVGDFTVELAGNSNSALNTWDHIQAAVPGAGRLAIRWRSTWTTSWQSGSGECLIDDLTVTTGGVTPLLPQPGQTVHWTAAMSPIHLTNQQVIPAGATLVIDPGVTVFFDATTQPFVGGEMQSHGGTIHLAGTAASPVVLRRGANTTQVPGIRVGHGGLLLADHVDSNVSLVAGLKGRLVARHCVVHRSAPIDWTSSTDEQYHVPTIFLSESTGTVTDCAFANAICSVFDSMVKIERNTFTDSLLKYDRFRVAQPTRIDGNTFSATDERAPLALQGYDYHVGGGNSFLGNARPIDLFGAGLTPDSVVPTTGNVTNRVQFTGSTSSEIPGPVTLPGIAVPYAVPYSIGGGNQYDSLIRILPGAVLEMGPQVGFLFEGVARIDVRGTPDEPVLFRRAQPNAAWIAFTTASSPPVIVRNARMEGAQWALGTTDAQFVAQDCEFVGNAEGIRVGDLGLAYVSRCRFLDNVVGINIPWAGLSGIDLGHLSDYGAGNDNSFEGAGQAIVVDPTQLDPFAMENAWWDHASGPSMPTNPGGTGQTVTGAGDVTPFRTTPVDFADHPPVVDVVQVAKERWLRPGSKIVLHWTAKDDAGIVAQRLEYRGARGMADSVIVIPSISPLARSVELTIPDTQSNPPPGWPGDQQRAVFRIVAVDAKNQEGFDDFHWSVTTQGTLLPVAFTTDLSSGFEVGERFDLVTTLGGGMPFRLFLDDLPRDFQPMGTGGPVLSAGSNTMPAVSTDLARYAIEVPGGLIYSPYFSIRPASSFGDLPPVVSLTSPPPGTDFTGGSIVPIRWIASDDRAVRSFDLQASYDGTTWHPFVEGLPGTTTEYFWQLPTSSGVSDVRIRVIARDSFFQVGSTSSPPFDILAGGSVWYDLGNGLAGATDTPRLTGAGSLAPNTPFQLDLSSARPNEPLTILAVGLNRVDVPLLGGVLVPSLDIMLWPIPTRGYGGWSIAATWPAGVPPGTHFFFQAWIVDPSGPLGFTASNGLAALVP